MVRIDVGRLEAAIAVGQRIGPGFQFGRLADELGGKLRIRGRSGELEKNRGLFGEVSFAQHVDASVVQNPQRTHESEGGDSVPGTWYKNVHSEKVPQIARKNTGN